MRQPTRLVRVSCQHHAGPRSGARSRSHKFGRVLVEADPPARALGGPVASVNEEPSTGANGQKEEAASFFSWSESSCHGSSAAMGSNCAFDKQWSRDYPIPVTVTPSLPRSAPMAQMDKRKMQLRSLVRADLISLVRAVLIELSSCEACYGAERWPDWEHWHRDVSDLRPLAR